ncbi:MAG: hypothetical protein NVS2B7_31270 [Herpetosiphon sp.]
MIAICAVVRGADSWVEVEEWGHTKEAWLRSFLDLPNGVPSHDTFTCERAPGVFAALGPVKFQHRRTDHKSWGQGQTAQRWLE